ncbi:MAG: hypothetical protein BM562_08475 [Alphaproteobacteria bacterium MedPE-SWcel]|nr:MAG: hypothetical protein BM562_08475 [Alphaproteobacteria bacterium MedPE-SWcel]
MGDSPTQPADPVVLTVCTTCRRAGADPEATRPGRILTERLAERLAAAALPDGVTVRGVECLSACSRGCTLHLSGGPDRWSYIYGDLDPDTHLDDIVAGTSAYAATTDGFVPWRERPVVFRKQSIARIPPVHLPGVDLSADPAAKD